MHHNNANLIYVLACFIEQKQKNVIVYFAEKLLYNSLDLSIHSSFSRLLIFCETMYNDIKQG